MALVVDASMALAWCFPDESGDESDAVLSLARREVLVVPPHFVYEVANGLAVGRRRSRISHGDAALFVEALGELDIRIDGGIRTADILNVADDAAKMGLTVYDWVYLDLARTLGAPLGS